MYKIKNALIILICFFISQANIMGQNGSLDVRLAFDADNVLVINYDIDPNDCSDFVTIVVTGKIGDEIIIPLSEHIKGDVGPNVTAGEKEVRWDITKEKGVTLDNLAEKGLKVVVQPDKCGEKQFYSSDDVKSYEEQVIKYQETVADIKENYQFTKSDKITHILGGVLGVGLAVEGAFLIKVSNQMKSDLLEHNSNLDSWWDSPDNYKGVGRETIKGRQKDFAVIGAVSIAAGVGVLVTDYFLFRKRQKMVKGLKDISLVPVYEAEQVGVGLVIRF